MSEFTQEDKQNYIFYSFMLKALNDEKMLIHRMYGNKPTPLEETKEVRDSIAVCYVKELKSREKFKKANIED